MPRGRTARFGYKVIVAELEGTANYKLAKELGFKPVSAAEAAGRHHQILLPDELQARIYKSDEKGQAGQGAGVLHGFNIHFGQLPPKDVDVYMVAPKGSGHLVRRV